MCICVCVCVLSWRCARLFVDNCVSVCVYVCVCTERRLAQPDNGHAFVLTVPVENLCKQAFLTAARVLAGARLLRISCVYAIVCLCVCVCVCMCVRARPHACATFGPSPICVLCFMFAANELQHRV
jgi:hypothetical protein